MVTQKASTPPIMFGLKASTISASMGWGGQGGNCSLTLVDEGVAPSMPPAGTACGFAFQEFSFGGMLQRWTYKESQSGRLYDIVLESPAKLLDGVQVILDTFETGYSAGGGHNYLTDQVKNVWNAFAHFESYAYGGQFGLSEVNSAGMPVTKLFEALEAFGDPSGFQNSRGYPVVFGGKLVFGESEYTIDFGELKQMVLARAPHYRVKGPVQNLNGILADLTEVVQVDYFVQLEAQPSSSPGSSVNGAITDPHLKIRIADRATVSAGVINTYVDSVKGQGILASATIGEELQDAPTGKVLIGGPASRYYIAPIAASTSAFSVWGALGNNAAYLIGGSALEEWKNPFYSNLSIPVTGKQFNGSYTASVFELRMALGGQATWETYKMFELMGGAEKNGFNLSNAPFVGKVMANKPMLQLLMNNTADAIDLAITNAEVLGNSLSPSSIQISQDIFNAVKKVASTYYGQVFMVPLPFEPGGINNNLKFISDDVQYETSWKIAQSAWVENTPIRDWNFYDGDGKLNSVATFANADQVDYSPLGSDYAATTSGAVATTKGGPQKDIFWIGEIPYCIAKSGAQLRDYDDLTTPDRGLTVLAKLFFNYNIDPRSYLKPGMGSVAFPIPPNVVLPIEIGIPQESTRYTWGPWYAWSAVANGKSEVEIDSSLRPETFGSVAKMDTAGFGSVFSGLARIEAIETGSVELAQAPAFNMGDRFAGSGPYVTSLDISMGVDGLKTNYKFSTWTPSFGKLAKYNADRISKINKASIAFMKTDRGRFSNVPFPKFEFRKTEFGKKDQGGDRAGGDGMELFNGFFGNM